MATVGVKGLVNSGLCCGIVLCSVCHAGCSACISRCWKVCSCSAVHCHALDYISTIYVCHKSRLAVWSTWVIRQCIVITELEKECEDNVQFW